ncbi:MAG TPA: hypothetical protein VF505_07505 [Thermoanaerobaculia bacterium]
MATTSGLGFATEGAEMTLMSLSRVGPDEASRQLPAQHGIEACIAGVADDLPMQHAAAAGTAETKSTSAIANAPAKYFVHVQARFMMCATPYSVSQFHIHPAVALHTAFV